MHITNIPLVYSGKFPHHTAKLPRRRPASHSHHDKLMLFKTSCPYVYLHMCIGRPTHIYTMGLKIVQIVIGRNISSSKEVLITLAFLIVQCYLLIT